jgi:hypothetical protein
VLDFADEVNWGILTNVPIMEFFTNPPEIMSFASSLLLLLFTANQALDLPAVPKSEEDSEDQTCAIIKGYSHVTLDVDAVTRIALHNFRICQVFSLLDEEKTLAYSSWDSR